MPRREVEPKVERQTVVGKWFDNQITSATMQVENIPLEGVKGWGPYSNSDGQIDAWGTVDGDGIPTYKNFVFEGFQVTKALREVGAWNQTGVVEVIDPTDPDNACGTVGLLVGKETGKVLLLAVAEPFAAEPGSEPEHFVNLRASVQGSYTNISEHKVQNSQFIDINQYKYFGRINPSRILGKIRYGVSVVDEKDVDLNAYQRQPDGSVLSIGPNANWFSLEEVDQAIIEGVPMNGPLNTVLNIYKAMKSQGNI